MKPVANDLPESFVTHSHNLGSDGEGKIEAYDLTSDQIDLKLSLRDRESYPVHFSISEMDRARKLVELRV